MSTVISTDHVAPGARLAFWQSRVENLLTHLECTSDAAPSFSGRIKAHQSRPASVLEIGALTHTIARAKPKIAQAGEEQIFVCFQTEGKAFVEQDGREGILRPGDITLLDTSRTFCARFPERMSQLVLQVPRSLVRKQVGNVERFTATIVPSDSVVGGIARDFVGSLANHLDKLAADVAQRLTEQATEMALMAFLSMASGSEQHGVNSTVARSMLVVRGRTFIDGNLRNPSLSPSEVAQYLGISKRYLSTAFAEQGQSVERFIWDKRLDRCARDLRDAGQSGRAIGDIAFSWGFKSLTHFSQSFKTRFGKTPREFRKLGGCL